MKGAGGIPSVTLDPIYPLPGGERTEVRGRSVTLSLPKEGPGGLWVYTKKMKDLKTKCDLCDRLFLFGPGR